MKKILYTLLICIVSGWLIAQNTLNVHRSGSIIFDETIFDVDSIKLSNNTTSAFYLKTQAVPRSFPLSGIDSITFSSETVVANSDIYITYNGTSVSVINPMSAQGVAIQTSGATVVVTSTAGVKSINYHLSGTTSNGSFTITSDKHFNVLLENANITATDRPAIYSVVDKTLSLVLVDGTTNTLADGTANTQKAALYSAGQILFSGNGTLSVLGAKKHAICSDDFVQLDGGTINVTSAVSDGIHADYFIMNNGKLSILNTVGDGIDGDTGFIEINGGEYTFNSSADDVKGLKCDSIITVNGGTLNLTASGLQSKGVKSGQNITVNNGNVTVKTSGATALVASGSGYDPSYPTAIKCDGAFTLNAGTLNLTCTGKGGKGISADGVITVNAGTIVAAMSGDGATYTNASGVVDSYNSTCLSSDANILLLGGTITLTNSGSGGKGISTNGALTIGSSTSGPTLGVTTSGSEFAVSSAYGAGPGGSSNTDYCSPKAVKADGALLIENGNVTVSSTDDGFKSETSFTMNNGNVTVSKSYEGVESKIITMNGGTLSVTASNDAINATMGTTSGGTESNDGSYFYMNGGTLMANATSGDAVDSNGNIVMNGGVLIANGPSSGVEEAFDFNGTFKMVGGLCVGGGSNSNMTKAMSTSSTQANMYITSSSQISSSTFLHITVGGVDMVTFKSKYGAYKFLFSNTGMTKGAAYQIYTGGSYSGGTSVGGVYTGGTYSGGTSKKAGTLSTSSTVTTISF